MTASTAHRAVAKFSNLEITSAKQGIEQNHNIDDCYPVHMSFEPPTSAENNSSNKSPAKSGKKLSYFSLLLSLVAIVISLAALSSSAFNEVSETAITSAPSDTSNTDVQVHRELGLPMRFQGLKRDTTPLL
jgi:hypothetical protein